MKQLSRHELPLKGEEVEESAKNSKKCKKVQLTAMAKKSAEIDSINNAEKKKYKCKYTGFKLCLTKAAINISERRTTHLKLAESNSKVRELREHMSDRKVALKVKR